MPKAFSEIRRKGGYEVIESHSYTYKDVSQPSKIFGSNRFDLDQMFLLAVKEFNVDTQPIIDVYV